jgi:hypothetical protein
LQAVGSGPRLKGWQAEPLAGPLAVALAEGGSHGGRRHAALGYGVSGALKEVKVPAGARLLLAQEVRNPRAGRYTFTVHASGGGSSAAYFREVFLKHFACRLTIFGFTGGVKNPRKVRVFASLKFRPRFAATAAGYEKFAVKATLRSQDGGAFELSRGVGVAVLVEKATPGELRLDAVSGPHQAFLRVDDVSLDFVARPRDDDVQV